LACGGVGRNAIERCNNQVGHARDSVHTIVGGEKDHFLIRTSEAQVRHPLGRQDRAQQLAVRIINTHSAPCARIVESAKDPAGSVAANAIWILQRNHRPDLRKNPAVRERAACEDVVGHDGALQGINQIEFRFVWREAETIGLAGGGGEVRSHRCDLLSCRIKPENGRSGLVFPSSAYIHWICEPNSAI